MNASRTIAAAWVAGALAPQAGCSVVCRGPGCEDSWPASRLSIVRGAIVQPEIDVAAPDARLDGTEIEGASWSVDVAPGGAVLIGQPEDSRVVLVTDTTDGTRTLRPEVTWTGAGTELGASIAVRRATDGSGTWDLLAGAPGYSFGRGALVLFRDANADAGRTLEEADLLLVGASANDGLGARIFPCADLTGDRIPEYAVTAPWFTEPAAWDVESPDPVPRLAGAVFLIQSSSIANKTGAWSPWEVGRVWWGSSIGEGAGTAVSCDRDLDGDGLVDVVIGAPWADGSRGRIYLLSGDPLPPSGQLDRVSWATVEGREATEWFGHALTSFTVGGEPRLAVGAPGWSAGAGRVHVYPGSALRSADPRRVAVFEGEPGRNLPDHFGRWLYTGDVDGDRLPDVLIGAPDYKVGRNGYDSGRMWTWWGAGSDGWGIGTTADEADQVVVGTQPFQRVGRAARVSDLDDDGVDDLLLPIRAPAPR